MKLRLNLEDDDRKLYIEVDAGKITPRFLWSLWKQLKLNMNERTLVDYDFIVEDRILTAREREFNQNKADQEFRDHHLGRPIQKKRHL